MSGPELKTNARWIILSPHLDDASLSIGGLIAALRRFVRVEVWTIFCSATFQGPYSEVAQWLHESSGGATGIRLSWLREKEDRGACRRLGASPRHLPWKDSPYRKTTDGKFMYNGRVQPRWHSDDEKMLVSIASDFKKEFRDGDVIVAPLSVGNHVDHQITRRVAEMVNPPTLLYYPDFPYVVTYNEQLPQKTERLCTIEYTLTPGEVDDWIAAVRCYVTQMRMLERAVGSVPELVRQYATGNGLHLFRPRDSQVPDLSAFGFFRSGETADAQETRS